MRSQYLSIPLVPIVAIGAILGCHADESAPLARETAASEDGPRPKVVALGRLEPAGGLLAISAVPGERLVSLNTSAGESVSEGQVLGELSSYEARAAEVEALEHRRQVMPERWQRQIAVAEARVQQATAALEQAQARQQEVELQKSALPLLDREANRAEVTYYKLSEMAAEDKSLATERELERYELLRDKAVLDHEQAKKRYQLAKTVANRAVDAAQADVVTAQASLEELRLADPEPEIVDQLKVATIQRDASILRSPIDGQVLKVFVQAGEVVTDRPVLQITNLDEMVCIAEVYEADAKRIQAGSGDADQARIVSKAFHEEFEQGIWGTVEQVATLVAPPGLQSRNPLAPADRSIVEVRIRIGAGVQNESLRRAYTKQAAELVSLQVKVEFHDAAEASRLMDSASDVNPPPQRVAAAP